MWDINTIYLPVILKDLNCGTNCTFSICFLSLPHSEEYTVSAEITGGASPHLRILSWPTSVPLLPASFGRHLFPDLEPVSHLRDSHILPTVVVPAPGLWPFLSLFQPYAFDVHHDHNPAPPVAPLFFSPKQHSTIEREKNQLNSN